MALIEIRLFGHLREYLPDPKASEAYVEMEEGQTVGRLLDRLGIPPQDPKIILVNGVHARRETVLKEGDRVSVFPPVAGG